MMTFKEAFEKSVAASMARQLALADHLEERHWAVNIPSGVASFGDDLVYPIQLLGTESEFDATWMWAWANEGSKLPTELLASVDQVLQFGEEHEVVELSQPHFSLDGLSGHMMAMVCSEIGGRHCYYRGPYEGGALYFLLMDTPSELVSTVRPERAVTVLTEVISQFEVSHREMVLAFFSSQGLRAAEDGSDVIAAWPDGNRLCVSFDDGGLIVRMEAMMSDPGKQKTKIPWWKKIF